MQSRPLEEYIVLLTVPRDYQAYFANFGTPVAYSPCSIGHGILCVFCAYVVTICWADHLRWYHVNHSSWRE